jgi:membrane protein
VPVGYETNVPRTDGQTPYLRVLVSQLLFKRVLERLLSDNCVDLAAQVSFYFVLSLFPFFLVLAAIVGWLPSTNIWQALVQWISTYLPQGSRRLLFSVIFDLTRGYTKFLSFGLLAGIWSASSGFVSLMEALSIARGAKDSRSYFKKRVIAIAATLAAAVFFLVIFALTTVGHDLARIVADQFTVLTVSRIPWEVTRWLANFVVILAAIDLVNYFLPDIKRTWRWLTPGTSFVALAFVLASVGFNFYIRHTSAIPKIYGTLAGFIIFMLWIYMASLILLIGAEADTVMDELSRDGAKA